MCHAFRVANKPFCRVENNDIQRYSYNQLLSDGNSSTVILAEDHSGHVGGSFRDLLFTTAAWLEGSASLQVGLDR